MMEDHDNDVDENDSDDGNDDDNDDDDDDNDDEDNEEDDDNNNNNNNNYYNKNNNINTKHCIVQWEQHTHINKTHKDLAKSQTTLLPLRDEKTIQKDLITSRARTSNSKQKISRYHLRI